MAIQFRYGWGTTAWAALPFTPLSGEHASGAPSSSADATVLVEATGTQAAGSSTSVAAAKVRVDGVAAHQAADAASGGVLHARLLISGAGYAANAISGGIIKPPLLQTAAQARTGQVHIVKISALRRALTRSIVNFIYGWGTTAWASLPDETTDSALVELNLSDRGYTSPPTGSSPNTIFDGRVLQPLQITRTIPVTPESDRRVALELGAITLANNDGYFDKAAAEWSVDGRLITVLLGLNTFDYDDFWPVFTGRATSWLASYDKLSVELRDQSCVLDVTLQSAVYGGTGGADGDASLAGKPKPHCFGKCRFITPVAVDPENLVYQFHWQDVEGVDAVYDRCVGLTATSDYDTYEDLIAASLSIGEYATCVALGMVRVGATPTFLTLDVRGEATGSYVDTTVGIAQRLILGYGTELTSGNLDAAAWSALAADIPGTIGIYFTDTVLISDAVSQVLSHCGAWWGASPEGQIGASFLNEPDASDIAYTFDAGNVKRVDRVDPPSGSFPPRWRQRVGYRKAWTVHSTENIAGTVSAATVSLATQEYRIVSSKSDNVRTEFLTALDPDPLSGLFESADDAQAVSDRWLALLSEQRETYQIVTNFEGYIPKIGKTVKLNYPRVASGDGWLARIIDVEIDAQAREITMMLWG
jgi:hypothetical protein